MRSADSDLIARWRAEPAPLLGLLHAFHERDGHLSDEALHAVAEGLRMSLADLYGTVEFYHHFSREAGGRDAPRVCGGPICKTRGSDALLAELDGASPMPCAGRCDEPIPVLCGGEVLVGTPGGGLRAAPTPLPPPNPDGLEECCFARVREAGRATLAGYGGSYRALARARELGGEALLSELDASGLVGRGGAGFSTARKWRAVREAAGGPKTIVCNADEGEPGCFKDRVLLDHDPHAVLEGMAVAAEVTGATRGFVYLRYEYPHTQAVLERAIEEARGELGEFELNVRRGAGAYICGEETSLLNSLEGAHPFPRNRPPFPVTHGFEGTPTAVNNVETLASVPPIVERGADWYAGLGLGKERGTKIISLSGDVRRPGNYEVPIGFSLTRLLFDWAGGPGDGRGLQAITMAGLSGGFLGPGDFDATLDEPCLKARGSFLGAGGVMVFDDRRDMVDVARQAMAFFADESCGKCFPCRIGTQRLTERLAGVAGPTQAEAWKAEVGAIGDTMSQLSACGLGIAAPLITESLLRLFPERVDEALARR
ncbi:MAG: hypothetical protein CMJ84_02945 [Planctomycetes bacterium]|nr:hypothetical protein [Planctomycetota bacterium]MDP6408041.1 NADH-ubiquinone oxidoreductase-F iron-sulfur binding region domain-containing protein [Planctomycetota bacterium]